MVGKKILKYSFISLAAVSVLSFAIIPLLKSNQNLTDIGLPIPGSKLLQSEAYVPVHLKGLRLDPKRPNQIDFFIDTGSQKLSEKKLKSETDKLVDYFLASLTVAAEDLWVNLSPYEKDRIIPEALGDTDMGAQLLAQDYMLKQLTASLSDPETKLGKDYWAHLDGSEKEESNTFNKVWIVPSKAKVLEHNGVAVISESNLKAMMESDYNALKQNKLSMDKVASDNVMRDKILPIIENEVNVGKNFAPLRQAYSAMILSNWFKKSVSGHTAYDQYKDSGKIKGIEAEDQELPNKIYVQYVDAFDKGVYKYVKTKKDEQGNSIKRQYVSGGFAGSAITVVLQREANAKQVETTLAETIGESRIATYEMKELSVAASAIENYSDYVLDTDVEITDDLINRVGKKAFHQLEMKNRLGLRVPEFAIVTSDLMRAANLKDIDWKELAKVVLESEELKKMPEGSTLAIRPAGIVHMAGLASTIKKVPLTVDAIAESLETIAYEWDKPTIVEYRKAQEIGDDSKFGFLIQREVHGDMNLNSCSGSFDTRDASTGEDIINGDYSKMKPGEVVRNGVGPQDEYLKVENTFSKDFPSVAKEFEGAKDIVEAYYKYPQVIEFVVEDGVAYYLQTVELDVSPAIERVILKDFLSNKRMSIKQFTGRKKVRQLVNTYNLSPEFENDNKPSLSNDIIMLSNGAMAGEICFSVDQAKQIRELGKRAILVQENVAVREDEFLSAIIKKEIDGFIFRNGVYKMHAARLARNNGIPGIALIDDRFKISEELIEFENTKLSKGDAIAFNENAIYKVAEITEDALELKESVVVQKTEIEELNVIRKKVYNFCAEKSYTLEDLMILHSLLYANVFIYEKGDIDLATYEALDLVTTKIHDFAKEKFGTLLRGDNDGNKHYDIDAAFDYMEENVHTAAQVNPAFFIPYSENLDPGNITEFMHHFDYQLGVVKRRYEDLELSSIDYPNFAVGNNEYSSEASTIPIEFSLISNSDMLFSGESLDVLKHSRDLKFIIRYATSESGLKWSSSDSTDMPDIELTNVKLVADKLDSNKIRVKGNIVFPKHYNRVNFTINAQDNFQDNVWLKSDNNSGINIKWTKLMSREDRKTSIVENQKLKPTNDLANKYEDKEVLLGELKEYFKLSASKTGYYHRYNYKSIIERQKKMNMGNIKEEVFWGTDVDPLYMWDIKTDHLKQLRHGHKGEAANNVVDDFQVRLEEKEHMNALAELLNEALGIEAIEVKSLDWTEKTQPGDMFEITDFYNSYWISINETSLNSMVDKLFELQNSYNISSFFTLTDEGVFDDIDLASIAATIYSHSKSQDSRKGGFDFSGSFVTVEGSDGASVYGGKLDKKIGQLLGLEPQLLAIQEKDDLPIFKD